MLTKRGEVDRAEYEALNLQWCWCAELNSAHPVQCLEEGRRASENDGVTGPSLGPLIGPLPWPIHRPFPGYRPHGNHYNPPANC
ncbi:unnamed protein product, partial [Cyprideis torosa]